MPENLLEHAAVCLECRVEVIVLTNCYCSSNCSTYSFWAGFRVKLGMTFSSFLPKPPSLMVVVYFLQQHFLVSKDMLIVTSSPTRVFSSIHKYLRDYVNREENSWNPYEFCGKSTFPQDQRQQSRRRQLVRRGLCSLEEQRNNRLCEKSAI